MYDLGPLNHNQRAVPHIVYQITKLLKKTQPPPFPDPLFSYNNTAQGLQSLKPRYLR